MFLYFSCTSFLKFDDVIWLIKRLQLYTALQLQNDSRACLGPNFMLGPFGASTPLHGDGRCCDISAIHVNVYGQNEVMIFPRQATIVHALKIFELMYKHDDAAPNTGVDGSDVFLTPRNRVRCIFAHSHSLYHPFLYLFSCLLQY